MKVLLNSFQLNGHTLGLKTVSFPNVLFQVAAAMKLRFLSSTSLLVTCLSCITAQAPIPMPDCSPCWCDSAGNCPDPRDACPPVKYCNTGVVKDNCGCCYVCLKSIGEPCRREPLEKQDEKCDRGLICLKGDDSWYCENMKPENVKVSRCEKG